MSTGLATSRPAAEVQDYLREQIGELATACPRHLTPERLIQVASICVYKTPKIAECDKASILTAILQAGSLGLDLSPNRGEAYLIPRWNKNTRSLECQFQPGYKGLVKLARNGGDIAFIQARLVHHKDRFRYWHEDDVSHLEHEPSIEANPGIVTHVYCLIKLRSGDRLIEVMSKAEVDEIRQKSERPDSGPWADQWGEMAKKTVLKRATKTLDQSPELAAAIEADNREYEEAETRPALVDNRSGHATGKYASPEQTAVFRENLEKYIAQRNSAWLDRWQDDLTGDFPEGVKELCNVWQADNHLVKWARETGRLDPRSADETGVKNNQIGRFTAILYHRNQEERRALTKELARYIDEQERRQGELLKSKHPELFGDSPEATVEADDTWEEGRE